LPKFGIAVLTGSVSIWGQKLPARPRSDDGAGIDPEQQKMPFFAAKA